MKIILSPHVDDAFLSLGGSILRWRQNDIAVRVLNVFTLTDYVSCRTDSAREVDAVTALRKAEEEAVCTPLGVKFEFLAFPDMPLRDQSSLNHPSDEQLSQELSVRLQGRIEPNDELFVPLAIGYEPGHRRQAHRDHRIVREAALRLADQVRVGVRLYEDQPYSAQFGSPHDVTQWIKQKLEAELGGRTLVPELLAIDIESKLRVVGLYRSQIESKWPKLLASYHRSIIGGQCLERIWHFKS